MTVFAIQCSVKKYHWGNKGSRSTIAKLIKYQNPNYTVDENTCYAELWMGTHSSGPALMAATNEPLASVLQKSPQLIGNTAMIDKYGLTIPFLFKLLSIEQPLSIQSHPDKQLAKILNETDSANYPDQNHKPEMAIAISEFGALLSFRPIEQIKMHLQQFPELRAVVGEESSSFLLNATAEQSKNALQMCFTSLMHASHGTIESNLKALKERFNSESDKSDRVLKSVFNKLNTHYPNDIGCFSLFFLNYLQLKPFEAIFLPPNEPHAYLYGDCIECMACSDNVIRAGLTPKFKDVQTLCNTLTYDSKSVDSLILNPSVVDEFTSVYKPNVEEFAVDVIKIPKEKQYTIAEKESASFLIVLEGIGLADSGMRIQSGFTFFLPAKTPVAINSVTENVVIFRSFCPISG